jgi:hypothetical protein
MRRTIRLLAVGALTASVVVALPASSAVAQTETVLTGVDNGRGLAFDDAGNLYIASAGTGGAGPCIGSPEGEGETCYGETGQIHVLAAGDIDGTPEDAEDAAQVLVDNLPSLAPQEGDLAMGDAIGPADVWPGADGRLYFTIGLGADPAVRDGEIDGAGLEDAMAALHSVVTADGSDLTLEADLGALEAAEDPDEAGPDSNPFGVVAPVHRRPERHQHPGPGRPDAALPAGRGWLRPRAADGLPLRGRRGRRLERGRRRRDAVVPGLHQHHGRRPGARRRALRAGDRQ